MVLDFSQFIGENVFVVYQEGDSVQTRKGVLASFDKDFVEIKMKSEDLILNKKNIVSVSVK